MIEAGLGGRYDATNVIPSKVQVLTGVGLEHTRWLGPTIARHRRGEARGRARPRDARVGALFAEARRWPAGGRRAPRALVDARRRLPLRARAGRFQRRTSPSPWPPPRPSSGRALDPGAVAAPPRRRGCPGAWRRWAGRPLTLRRRPQPGRRARPGGGARPRSRRAAAARPGARRARGQGRRGHAGGAAAGLRPAGVHALRNPRSLSPATLEQLAARPAGPGRETSPSRARALDRARALAGPGGAVLATGSIYLVADLVRPAAPRAPPRCKDAAAMDREEGPGFGAMIGLVALVVATVILVFFGIGYLLGACSCRASAATPVHSDAANGASAPSSA